MNTPVKCFFVYQPEKKDFEKINFQLPSKSKPDDGTTKTERKLTQPDELAKEDLGSMEFEPITLKPTH